VKVGTRNGDAAIAELAPGQGRQVSIVLDLRSFHLSGSVSP
jgi:hypothetical protein